MMRFTPVVAALALALGAAPAQAVTNTFTGATSSDWNTGSNWSQNHVPTSGEDVAIDVSTKNPSLSADGVANSVTVAGANILTVTAAHTLAVGAGASSLAGQLVISSGGVFSLSGPMSVTHGGGPANAAISGNVGTANRLDILSGGTLDFASDANAIIDAGAANLLVHVLAGGTLKQTATGTEGGSVIHVAMDNDGQVLATAGKLLLRGGSGAGRASSGTYDATSPARIAFQGTTDLSTTGRLTGTGTMEFNSGTLTIPTGSVALPSPYDPAATSFTLGDLSLGSNGSTGTLTSIGGNRLGSATLTVTGATAISQFGMSFNGGTTNLQGTTTISAGMGISGATVNLGGAAALDAGGAINVATGSLNVKNGSSLTVADNVNIFSVGAGTLHVDAGGTLTRSAAGVDGQLGIPVTNQGTIHAAGGIMRFNLGLTQTAGVTVVDATLGVQGGFEVALQGGTLSGNGTVSAFVDNTGGTVAPGASPGLLTITGDYTQGAGGTLAEEITGTALAAFDRLSVSGTASLGGTLAIDSSAFAPAPTDTFKIISGAATRTGTFATLTGADVNGAHYSPQYDADGVTLLASLVAPSNTTAPSIPAGGHPGDVITCDPGSWTGSPTFTFAWSRDGTPVAGQTGPTYTLTADDAGHEVRCIVVAHNAGGDSTPASSNALAATAVVTPPVTTPAATTPPATQPPAPKQVPITQIVSLPSAHVCASRRHFRIHLRNHGLHPVTATVFVNGRRVKVVTGSHLAAEIDLRGLPKGTIRVRITIRYREGKALTGVRTYHTCTARRHKAKHHRV
jgi:fibronectin-binding autotransporter adhesin